MRLIFLSIFIVLLHNCCLGEPIRNTGSQENPTQTSSESLNNNRHRNNTTNDGRKLNLEDLNTDCLLLIFEQLDPVGLVNIAQVTPYFASLAHDVFRRIYPSNVEITKNSLLRIRNESFEIDSHGDDNRLIIDDLELSLNVMKYFGSAIRKLIIRNRYLETDSNIIRRMANQYLSKSLIELDLRFVDANDTFGVLPFEKVEYLKFIMMEICEPSKDLPFNKQFPKLRHLEFQVQFDMDYDFLDCELPHLDFVRIGVAVGAWRRFEQINGLLRKNPQIRSVVVDWSRPEYIIDISKLLPNLQNLTFLNTNVNIQKEKVHFENVEMFSTVRSPIPGSLKNLSFSKLKNISLSYNFRGDRDNEWIEFFKRHQNVSELHLTPVPSGMVFPLVQFTNDLINLTVVTVESYTGFKFGTILNFIKNHEKLMKFKFPINEPDRTNLVEHFQHEWHIQVLDDLQSGLVFERKTVNGLK